MADRRVPGVPRELRPFALLWLGQLVSLLGNGLTGFALAVWVFQQTGSASQFGLVVLCGALPGIVVSPFAGVLVDRWDRRRVLLACDLASALLVSVLAAAHFAGGLAVWHVYAAAAFAAAVMAFQGPALGAATTLMVPAAQLGRAAGMSQFAQAAAQIAAPALAGLLVTTAGLGTVLLADLGTFLFAVATLAVVRIPAPPAHDAPAEPESMLRDSLSGLRWIRTQRGLLALLVFFAAINFCMGIPQVLLTPMVLSFAPASALGMVVSCSGVGMLVGSVAVTAWGGPRRQVRGIVAGGAVFGLALVLTGLRPSVPLIAGASFAFAAAVPLFFSSNQALWQRRTPPHLQGRVFATRSVVGLSAAPLSFALAGPLAERVFDPLMAPGGPLAGSVGALLGTGAGRGSGLLFMVCGAAVVLATVAVALLPRVRGLDDEHPEQDIGPRSGADRGGHAAPADGPEPLALAG